MKIRSDYYWVPWAVFGVLCAVLIFLTILLSPQLFKVGAPPFIVQIIDFICGFFITCAISMMLAERSRFCGFIVLITSIPLILYFTYVTPHIQLDSLIYGAFFGLLFSVWAISKLQFNQIGKWVKYLFDLLLVIFVAYLLFTILQHSVLFSTQNVLIPLALLFIVVVVIYYYIISNLTAIPSQDIFIYGRTGSGKSVFLAELNHYLIDNHNGENPREFIIFPGENEKSANIREISLGYMTNLLINGRGKEIRSTRMTEFAFYILSGRRWKFIPIPITAVDYAGGFIGHFTKNDYIKSLDTLSTALTRNKVDLEKDISNIEYLRDLSRENPTVFFDHVNDVITAYLYRRMSISGKIIFLIDGDLLSKNTADITLNNYLLEIADIINEMGSRKHYGFVITKADKIPEIRDMVRESLEDSEKANLLETEQFNNLLKSNYVWKGIFEKINHDKFLIPVTVEGVLLSVDASKREGDEISSPHPWRFNKIVDFLFKF